MACPSLAVDRRTLDCQTQVNGDRPSFRHTSRAAQRLSAMLPLMLFDIPLDLPEIQIAMYWHERTHHSDAHQWFREKVREALPQAARVAPRLKVAR